MFRLSNNSERTVKASGASPVKDSISAAAGRDVFQLGQLRLNKSYKRSGSVSRRDTDVYTFKVNQSAVFPTSQDYPVTFSGSGSLRYILKEKNTGKKFASGRISTATGSSSNSGSSTLFEAGTYELTIQSPSTQGISYNLNFKLTNPFSAFE